MKTFTKFAAFSVVLVGALFAAPQILINAQQPAVSASAVELK